MNNSVKLLFKYKVFVFWLIASMVVGICCGVVGALFHMAISFATNTRQAHSWLIYLLPVGGVIIALLYRLSHDTMRTNTVIECIRESKKASPLLAPLIFVGAFITHLLGGSAGREGAALQIGGGIGSTIAQGLRLKEEDAGIMIVCGMSGAFSAIFTTPVTAAVMALEIVSVGHIRYFQLLPCMISSICGYLITLLFGNEPLYYALSVIPALSPVMCIKVIVLAIATSLLSVIFCKSLHFGEHIMTKIFKRDYIKAFAGGCIVILLTLIVGRHDYNGAGMDIIDRALLDGVARPEAFVLKILFTAVTVGAGFKGGEIVPAFFVGTTFGVVAGGLLGIDPSFAAALSMICMFCGIANCPMSSVILGVELFGSQGIAFFALTCGVCFIISGRAGLYKSQKIVYSDKGVMKKEKYVK
ncbi:MAG: chloride channel protein [Clostridia bacterium]|nr:chloride channel protein [Clostridia bacterium]